MKYPNDAEHRLLVYNFGIYLAGIPIDYNYIINRVLQSIFSISPKQGFFIRFCIADNV